MNDLPTISIIGPGKVGIAIGMLARRGGVTVAAVGGRDAARTAEAASRIGSDVPAVTPAAAAGMADVVLLTVPDDAIASLCKQLASAKAFRCGQGVVVAHCSGALASDILQPAVDCCGCHVGSIHPLQTFPTVEAAVAALPGAHCFIEGDAQAVASLRKLAEAIGAVGAIIPTQDKALYHAAAVMACNYLATLMDAAGQLGERAGVDRATFLRALEPLVRATVDNVFAMGPAAALTGPIARGDGQTVQRHLKALEGDPQGLDLLYRALGLPTVRLAVDGHKLDAEAAKRILGMLSEKKQQ